MNEVHVTAAGLVHECECGRTNAAEVCGGLCLLKCGSENSFLPSPHIPQSSLEAAGGAMDCVQLLMGKGRLCWCPQESHVFVSGTSEGEAFSILPGCSLQGGSWAGRRSLVRGCLLPGRSPSAWRTAGSSCSLWGRRAPPQRAPAWRATTNSQSGQKSRAAQPAPANSHVQPQVPDLQLSLADDPKHGRLPRGPLDVLHSSMGAREGHQGTRAVLLPQLDGAVGGAAQEHIRAEWRPGHSVDSTLRRTREFSLSQRVNEEGLHSLLQMMLQ